METSDTAHQRRLRRDARIAGLLYLLVVGGGLLGLAWAPGQLGPMSNPAAVASTLMANAGAFRLGIAGLLVMEVAFLLLPLALYRIFRDVDRAAATLMAALAMVSVPIMLVGVAHRWDALAALQAGALPGDSEAANAAWLSLRAYASAQWIASLFWGLWLFPFGWLVLRSGRIPRLLGALLLLGGLGYVADVSADLVGLATDSAALRALRLCAAAGEIGSALWLSIFGARAGRSGKSGESS
ncbi:MAG: DUF4386 domain-containing protein [Pseudoxanthomonas sp.]